MFKRKKIIKKVAKKVVKKIKKPKKEPLKIDVSTLSKKQFRKIRGDLGL